jgi:hypothetical protein
MISHLRRLLNWFRPGSGSAQRIEEDLLRVIADAKNSDELRWLDPPANPEDVAGWDQYWTEQVAHGLGPPIFDMLYDDGMLVRTMNDEGMTRILCAGNGISQEPKALAAAGFEVVALDLSPRAIEIARSGELTAKYLQHFFDSAMLRPGGRVDFVVGDIRDSTVCPGPFDVIIERCTAQLYCCNRRVGAILNKLEGRLASNGILLSHCHDGAWKPPAEPRHFTESWFEQNGWRIWKAEKQFDFQQRIWTFPPQKKPSGRVAWLSSSTG